jgi:hypothetical protein
LEVLLKIGELPPCFFKQSPNRIWQFSLSGRNLTNNKFFEEIFVSDYYTSSSHQSLNRAFVLAEMSFNF